MTRVKSVNASPWISTGGVKSFEWSTSVERPCFSASFWMIVRLSCSPWCGIKRMLAPSVASCGMTLYASEPDCVVKAMVVFSIAPACALTAGRTAFKSGENSHRLPSSSRRPNDDA